MANWESHSRKQRDARRQAHTPTRNRSTRHLIEALRRSLARQQEPFPSDSKKHRGAVGILIKDEADDLWLLMIRRRENPKDPWSGQMAFPGGRADPRDRTLLDTAAREVIEEVGIDVRRHEFIGCLQNIQTRNAPMIVAPFTFLLTATVHPTTSREATEILWVPMSFLLNEKSISHFAAPIGEKGGSMPCYRYSDHVIWGLSFRIIREIVSKMTSDPYGQDAK